MSTNVKSGKFYAFSVYLKYVDWQYISLDVQDSRFNGSANIVVDLVNGTITKQNGYSNGTITDVGNGWYRAGFVDLCSASSTNTFMIYQNVGGTTLDVTGVTSGKKWLVWGMQVEQRDAITAYTPTSGTPIVKYQPTLQTAASGEARFDHDPVTGESKGLLIEEARTNLVTYSEGTAGWTLYDNGTIKNDVAVAPDGTRAAQVFNDDGGTGVLRILTAALTNGTTYTMSVYLKSNNAATPSVNLQIGDSTVVSGQALTNEWVRYSGSGTPAQTGYNFLDIEIPSGSDVSIWGTQIEAGSFPTSYIPTSGSTVTRSREIASITGSSFTDFFTSNAMTIFAKYSAFTGESDGLIVDIGNSTSTSDAIWVRKSDTADDFVCSGSGLTDNRMNDTNASLSGSVAYAVDYSGQSGCFNGNTVVTDNTDNSIASTLNRVTFMQEYTRTVDSSKLSGHMQKFAFYPQRLSNATLQAMTEE
jgi:hypothetical protein